MREVRWKAIWVWAGIVTLLLIGIYAAIGSGFASLRVRMEMTELAFFNWWPMRVMVGMLIVTLVMVHRWIPLTWERLGVWMTHVGILVLLAGCVLYFSQKTEGIARIYLNQSVGEYFNYDETERWELPVEVKLVDFKAVKFAGAMDTYQDFISTLELTDKKTGEVKHMIASLNNPAMSHGFGFFQAAWDGREEALPEERFTTLVVTNRPGLRTMTIGSILVFVGIGYAFYVKPMLRKRTA